MIHHQIRHQVMTIAFLFVDNEEAWVVETCDRVWACETDQR